MWESDNRALNLELSVLCSNADNAEVQWMVSELRILDHLRVHVSRKTQGRKEALVFGLNKPDR